MMNFNGNITLEITDNDIQENKNIIDNINVNGKSENNNKKRLLEDDVNKTVQKKIQVNNSRCLCCNRKIGLLGFQCKCKNYFCSEHRYSDCHDCTFDYKEHGKELLTKENPIVISSKINKI